MHPISIELPPIPEIQVMDDLPPVQVEEDQDDLQKLREDLRQQMKIETKQVMQEIIQQIAPQSVSDHESEEGSEVEDDKSEETQQNPTQCVALYDYEGNSSSELSFKKGTVMDITNAEPTNGWIQCKLNGKIGLLLSLHWS